MSTLANFVQLVVTGLGLGAGAVLGSEAHASAADRTASEQANIQVVTDFCTAWSTRTTRTAPKCG